MKRLLPHEERRMRHGFGMLGFPVGKEKGGRLGHDEAGEHSADQLKLINSAGSQQTVYI